MISPEQQVQAEAELASQLLSAPEQERQALYGEVYDRIYSMHLSRDPETLEFGASRTFLPFLLKLSRPSESVLEIGCGGGLMAIELGRAGREVTGVDVSQVILDIARVRGRDTPSVSFHQVAGVTLPYPDESFDCAYSIEVVEHMHECDAVKHFSEVRRVLKNNGRYWFLTPSSLASRGASERFGVSVDVGGDVHLKEWTYQELDPVLRAVGFRRAAAPIRIHRALYLPWMPLRVVALAERIRSGLVDRILGLHACSVVAFH